MPLQFGMGCGSTRLTQVGFTAPRSCEGLIAKACLAISARWYKAEQLRITQVRDSVIQFVKTKSSKSRAVPITENLEGELKAHHEEHSEDERIFVSAYSAFRESIIQAKLKMSDGQLTYILRHTFASHFMMNGGNILALQKLSVITA